MLVKLIVELILVLSVAVKVTVRSKHFVIVIIRTKLTVFTVFWLLTDFVCLYTYEF
jgi:hypothetical protein